MGKDEAARLQRDLRRYKARASRLEEWRRLPFGACVHPLRTNFQRWLRLARKAKRWQERSVTIGDDAEGDREWARRAAEGTDMVLRGGNRGCRPRGCRPTCAQQ